MRPRHPGPPTPHAARPAPIQPTHTTAMKLHPSILILLATALPAAARPFVPPATSNAGMRDVVTHEELAEQLAKQDQQKAARPAPATPAPPPATKEEWKPVDLLERSEFLSCNGLSTLVPKGSVLNVPAALRDRMRLVDGNRIVPWAEFFRVNRGWITTFEVSRRQAEADEPLGEETNASIAKSSQVVIATLSGGPITLLRSKPGAPAPPAAANGAATASATKP